MAWWRGWPVSDGFAFGLTLPAIAFVAVLGLWPLAAFIAGSLLSGDSGISFVVFQRLLGDSVFLNVASRTVLLAIGVCAIVLLLAFPLACVIVQAPGKLKTVMLALVALPYLTSVLVRVYAWAALLAHDGPVNAVLVASGVFERPQLLGHSMFGMVVGMVHILCPIAVLTLWSQMEKIPREHPQIAASLGAPPSTAFLTVFVPQTWPGVLSAASLVYVMALGAYVIPVALGSAKNVVFAQLVVEQATQILDWETAGAMGLAMLVIAALPLLAIVALRGAVRSWKKYDGLAAKRTWAQAIGPGQAIVSRVLHPALARVPPAVVTGLARVFAGLVLAFLVLPELVVVIFSFGPMHSITLPPDTWTLDGYREVAGDSGWQAAALRSVVYAAIDALLATLLGCLAAYGFARSSRRWAAFGSALLIAPMVLPEIVTAISYFVFATKIQLAGTDLGIVLGQVVGLFGLVALITGSVLRGVDESLEHAAQACGASRMRTLRDIVFPLIAPGVIVGFLYAFLHTLDNLVTPLFIAGTKSTLPVRMFLIMQEQLTTAPAVVASMLMLVLVIGLIVSWTLMNRHSAGLVPTGAH